MIIPYVHLVPQWAKCLSSVQKLLEHEARVYPNVSIPKYAWLDSSEAVKSDVWVDDDCTGCLNKNVAVALL